MRGIRYIKQDVAGADDASGGNAATVGQVADESNTSNIVPDDTTISSVSDLSETHAVVYEGFDPTVHAVDAEGNPKKKPDGTYAKKRGRKPGTTTASGAAGSALPPKRAPMSANAPSTVSAGLSSEAAARQFTNAFISGGVMIFGADWEPEDKSEPQELKKALQDYFDADGVPNIPPWFGVALAFGAYSAKRLTKPTILEKVGQFFHKIKTSLKGGVLL